MNIVLGIPTINRADLLAENLTDVSENLSEIYKLLIVDNGNQSIEIPENLKEKTTIHRPSSNLGVAGSWNYIIKTSYEDPQVDNVLILNDDIVLGKPFEKIKNILQEADPFSVIRGGYFWAVYCLSRNCWETIGSFDEQFYPAYYEDTDYERRIAKAGKVVRIHQGLTPEVKRNSMTIKKDPALNSQFDRNKKLFESKWSKK